MTDVKEQEKQAVESTDEPRYWHAFDKGSNTALCGETTKKVERFKYPLGEACPICYALNKYRHA